jgi:hypothetical protein
MKKTINEEKERIISLFGLNEQEENKQEMSIKDKLGLIKFNSEKGKEVKISLDNIDDILKDMEIFKTMGNNLDTSLIKAVISSEGGKDEKYVIVGGSFPSSIMDVTFDKDEVFGDYDGSSKFDYFKVESEGDNGKDFSLVRVESDELRNGDDEEESVEKEVETSVEEPVQKEPEQPFEEEMKNKEKKGLASLLDGNEPSNDFTKRQKKVLEKLKGEGYLLNRPENEEGYVRKKVTSKEFTESFNVWQPKK